MIFPPLPFKINFLVFIIVFAADAEHTLGLYFYESRIRPLVRERQSLLVVSFSFHNVCV